MQPHVTKTNTSPASEPDPGDGDKPKTPPVSQTDPSQPSASTTAPMEPPPTIKVSIEVPRDAVGFIIGKRGETVRNMMNRSRAFIAVDREDTNPHAPYRQFHIEGERAAVSTAWSLIREKVEAVLYGRPNARVQDAALTLLRAHPSSGEADFDIEDAPRSKPLEMWIPRGCVGMIIGQGGQVINEMQEKARATIVVHNDKMDRNGAKLLTISGGEREKQHAKELIQNILDRAGMRNRLPDHITHPQDVPWSFPPQQAVQPPGWYYGQISPPPLHIDPRQFPEFPPRFPHPPMQQWQYAQHIQGQPPAMMAPGLQAPPTQGPHQSPAATTPGARQPQHLQQQLPRQQSQQAPNFQQISQQVQMTQIQPGQPGAPSAGPAQQQAMQLPGPLQGNPLLPGSHMGAHVGTLYGQQVPPSGQLHWNTPGQIPYMFSQQIPMPFDGSQTHVQKVLKSYRIPSGSVRSIVGRNGETIRDLQAKSGALIKITSPRDGNDEASYRLVHITGSAYNIKVAYSLLNDIIGGGLTRPYRETSEQGLGSGHPSSSGQQTSLPESGETRTKNKQSESRKEPKTDHGDDKSSIDDKATGGKKKHESLSSPSKLKETNSLDPGKGSVEGGGNDSSKHTGPGEAIGHTGSTAANLDKNWVAETGEIESKQYSDLHDGGDGAQVEDKQTTQFTGEARTSQSPSEGLPENSITFEMKVPNAKVGLIIGKKGATIQTLQKQSGARIIAARKTDPSKDEKLRVVTIIGSTVSVDMARRLILSRINAPEGDQSTSDDKELGFGALEFDESLNPAETIVNSLAMEMQNQSLNSPLTHSMASSLAAPISPLTASQSVQYGPFQQGVQYIGPIPPMQFSSSTHFQNARQMIRSDLGDFRTLEGQSQQHTQFSPHFMQPQQFGERIPLAARYTFSPSPESAEAVQAGYGEFRPDQFFQQAGTNFAGMPVDGASPLVIDPSAHVGFPPSNQEFTEEVGFTPYQGDEFDQEGVVPASAS